jgi:hypothetical protein
MNTSLSQAVMQSDLEFALLRNLVIGLIDCDDLLGGDRDELLRQAARDQIVWMIFGDQFPVAAL